MKHPFSSYSSSAGRNPPKVYPVLTKVSVASVPSTQNLSSPWTSSTSPANDSTVSFPNQLISVFEMVTLPLIFHHASKTIEILDKDIFPITCQVCSILWQSIDVAFSASLSPIKDSISKTACKIQSASFQPHCLIHAHILLFGSLPSSMICIQAVMLSNGASYTGRVLNAHKSSSTWLSKWNIRVYKPNLQWLQNILKNALLNLSTRYFSSISVISLQLLWLLSVAVLSINSD